MRKTGRSRPSRRDTYRHYGVSARIEGSLGVYRPVVPDEALPYRIAALQDYVEGRVHKHGARIIDRKDAGRLCLTLMPPMSLSMLSCRDSTLASSSRVQKRIAQQGPATLHDPLNDVTASGGFAARSSMGNTVALAFGDPRVENERDGIYTALGQSPDFRNAYMELCFTTPLESDFAENLGKELRIVAPAITVALEGIVYNIRGDY